MFIAHLRLLATTDLHMQVQGYDYIRDQPVSGGLSALAPLITRLRAETPNTILVDNGDALQGGPLGDAMASGSLAPPHPMIDAFNALGYDAVTLGNHEFEYGLPWLDRQLADLQCPVVQSNMTFGGSGPDCPATVILDRPITCEDGATRTLRIGLFGVLPPQTANWMKHWLPDTAGVEDIYPAARAAVAQLKQAGAEIVIGLAHSGIGPDSTPTPGAENAVRSIAAIEGLDAVIAGHEHRLFPDPSYDGPPEIDIAKGQIAGTAVVSPGSLGRYLGVIDLDLAVDAADQWRVTDSTAQVLPAPPTEAPEITALPSVCRAHDGTRALMAQPLAQTARPLSSALAVIGQDGTAPIAAAANLQIGRNLMQVAGLDSDTLIVAVASYAAGSHKGPGGPITIDKGPVRRRDVAAIAPFNNPLTLVARSGQDIRDWLDFTSRLFHLSKTGGVTPLIDPRVPPYHFDTMFGLTYRIALDRPPRFDPEGAPNSERASRIIDLRHNGRAVGPEDIFHVVTSSYRARGGGAVAAVPEDSILALSQIGAQDALVDWLQTARTLPDTTAMPWQFEPVANSRVTFHVPAETPPELLDQPGLDATTEVTNGQRLCTLAL